MSIFSLFLFTACNSFTKDEVKGFIPGTYIRSSQNEFGKEYDTLVVSLQSRTANEYKIIRKWRYDRVLDGKPAEPEYKVTESSGIYDTEKKQLQETETLDFFTFDVEKKLMFNGANKFNKI
ncbi:MAG: hypothetical protein KF825_06725 [Ferruginibacter sp.]|nr:hypothetical protein [Ferruginibacter sp.]